LPCTGIKDSTNRARVASPKAEIAEQFLYNLGSRVAFGNQLAHAGHAHRDQRKFHRGEETVQHHQQENSDELDEEHSGW
jgi:hypothetical protein